jgi:hypothetical protein
MDSEQVAVWLAVGAPILDKAFCGYNGTIFAYGQTGSGKTWTMQGAPGTEANGIIPRMCSSLFERVVREKEERPSVQFLVTCSYFEIYNEVIYDLLDPDNRNKKGKGLEIKEHQVLGIYVKGLQEIVVDDSRKMLKLIEQGMASRTVSATNVRTCQEQCEHSITECYAHR